jgi:nucleoside-diphosphate-sugar epimerase
MGKGKILVTGGAGYIGILAVEELLSNGYSVRVFDKFFWGKEPLKHLKDRIEMVQGDIRKPPISIFRNINAVIHLAAFSNDPMADFDPETNYEVNTLGTKKIAQIAKKMGIKRFIFASSASIYDRGLDAKDALKNEKSRVKPKAYYSISKLKAEKELLKLADKDFCPVILRQGTVYGFSPRMRYDLVVNTMVRDALMGKELTVFCRGIQWRPLIEVRDVAKAYIACLGAPEGKLRGEIFNLLYDNFRVLEVAKKVKNLIEKIKKSKVKLIVDHSPRKDRTYRMAGKKIKKVLGYKPTISIEESIKDMIKEIEKNGFTDFMHPKYYNIQWMDPFLRAERNRRKKNK